jgi:fibronectin-binding autotransporter adhesin
MSRSYSHRLLGSITNQSKARSRALLLASAAGSLLSLSGLSAGSIVTWDASGINAAAPTDGAGAWSTTSANWSNGTADNVWSNSTSDTGAIGNGGAGGSTITVAAGGITIGGINLNGVTGASGYTITGGTIAVSGNVPIVNNDGTTNGTNFATTFVGAGGLSISGSGITNISATAAENSSYTGGTTISSAVTLGSGGVNAAIANPFGASSTIISGATPNILTLNNATISGKGSSSGSSISYTLPYNIDVLGTDTINTGKNFAVGINGTVDTVYGSGTLIFNQNGAAGTTSTITSNFSGASPNNFTGTLEVTGTTGTTNVVRAIVNGGQFGSGVPNGTFDLEGVVQFQVRTNSGGNTILLGALKGTASTPILGGTNNAAGSPIYSVGALGLNTTFAGMIQQNAGLTVTGGSLTLTNSADSYTGATTINGGTLFDNCNISASAVGFGTAANSILGGNGTLGGVVTVANGGIIAPGATASSIGTLTASAGVTFTGATAAYDDDINAAGLSDLLATTNLNLGTTSTLNVNVLDSTSGSPYTIATYSGTLTGTFATTNLPAGYSIDYGTGTNSSITLIVPEPASVGLLGIGSLALLHRRRRNRA